MDAEEKDPPFVSIVIPTKNESLRIRNCLDSLKALDYPQDRLEILVVDGHSADDTREIAAGYGATVVMNPRQTEPAGRNVGAGCAKGEWIAFTDADCVVDRNWLTHALPYFADSQVAGVGGVNIPPPFDSAFSKAIEFIFSQTPFSPWTDYGSRLKEAKPVRSLPWCNAVYKRSALEKVLPIDDSLIINADANTNGRLTAMGYKLLSTPDAFVWHHRRNSLKKLWIQIYTYAIGKVQAGRKQGGSAQPSYALFALSVPGLLALGTGFFLFAPKLFFLLVFAGLAGLLGLSALALRDDRSIKTAAYVPLVALTVLFACSAGYLRETFSPLKETSGR